ncbi:aminotransferase class IV [Ignavibacterium sp.]|uniref:aminotransferase class IV n=1 Tax=Ignavibacterium sp. TaxID=2651167 RepID=UPI00307EE782
MIAYYNGKFIPVENISVSPFDRGFLFADGVYETLRTYNKKLFMLQKHLERLQYSLNQLSINFHESDKIENLIYRCAELNNLNSDFSAYIQITRGNSFPRTHHFQSQIKPNLFINVSEIKNREKEINEGVSITFEPDIRWNRCDIKSISLLPNVLANHKAISSGHYEAVFFRDNLITEGTHTNFFAVKNGNVLTAPLSNFILNGVTRNIVFQLCMQNNIQIAEEYLRVNEIFEYDEFFITGTMTEITPAVRIDKRIIGDGKPGRLTKKIQKLFYEFVRKH